MNPSIEEARSIIKEINKDFEYRKEINSDTNLEDVIVFDSNYGRMGVIWIDVQTCIACKQRKSCLIIDQSEGEYNTASICFTCIDLLRKVSTYANNGK